MLLRTCFALFVVAGAWAQQTQPAKAREKGDGPLTRSSFSAKGLHREDDLTDLFVGNFADVTFDRGSFVFSMLFQSYLEAYWRSCGTFLTKKVEMTRVDCADAPAPDPPFRLDQPPPPSLPRVCSSWHTVSLGYADPALYAAKTRLEVEYPPTLALFGSVKNPMRPAIDAVEVSADMDALVRLNACAGPGLRRFQENVALFSMGKQPLLLPGASPVTPSVQPPGVLADSNYNRLVEDLVADQAKAWAFNRYVPGSTTLGIVAHDPRGQPSQIRAKYFFTSLTQPARTQGSVIVSFTDGMPACIYFSDAPTTCQTPNRRIVAKYSSGAYLNTNASPPASSPAAAAPVRRDEQDTRQSLPGTHQSPAAWDQQWMGQNMVITGTVSRVDVDSKGYPKWVTIYLKESPDATFVVCSPYADLFQERVGPNLSSLVGKTLEAAGQVESPHCGPSASKGSIRVLESKQWQVH